MSLSVGLSEVLHDIGSLPHQDLIRGLALLLQPLAVVNKLVEENGLSEPEEISKSIELGNIVEVLDLAEWALGQLRELGLAGGDILLKILANLDHEDSVVSLSGEAGMSNREVITELVASEVSLTTASLSADGCYSLQVPRIKSFVDAAEAQNLGLPSLWLLVNVLAHHMQKAKSHGPCEEGHQSVLLQLISEDRGVTLTLGPDSKPLLRVCDGDVEARSLSSYTHRGYAQSSRQ